MKTVLVWQAEICSTTRTWNNDGFHDFLTAKPVYLVFYLICDGKLFTKVGENTQWLYIIQQKTPLNVVKSLVKPELSFRNK